MDLVFVILLTLVMVPVALLAGGAPRIVLAAAFLVFFPGYTLVAALFPRKDSLDYLERVTLSLVLSIAVVPLLGMALNYTPWGIDTYPVVATVLGFVLVCSLAAQWRRYRLPEEERFPPRIRPVIPRLAGTMTGQGPGRRAGAGGAGCSRHPGLRHSLPRGRGGVQRVLSPGV